MSRSTTPRREFLKTTAAAGAGVVILADSRSAWSYQANEKLDIAFVGAAGMGQANLNQIRGLKENVVAFADVDEKRPQKSFEMYPEAKRFVDFRKMFDAMHAQIDAVVVATPDNTHAVAAVAAMKLGKHVYCEKPLTRTVFEARTMRETAARQKVVTQMGNQGSSSEGLRRALEMADAGVVGSLKEAYAWFAGGNGPRERPKDEPPVPEGLHWDLWLGPAAYRPYHPSYCPGAWRGWRAFGTGTLGDFGCHTTNLAFRALRINELWKPDPARTAPAVIRVETEASELDVEGYPQWMIVRYQIPARGKLPPIRFTYSIGGKRPDDEVFLGSEPLKSGCLLAGEKGAVFSTCAWNTRFKLLPEKQFEGFEGPEKTLPRSPGQQAEWVAACKGQGPKPFSDFAEIGGPMTELLLLGHVAQLAGGPIEYDPIAGKIVNKPDANPLLHREYRAGWTL